MNIHREVPEGAKAVDWPAEAQRYYEERNKLRAENERLRASLVEIEQQCAVGDSHTWIRRIARKALLKE